MRVSSQISDEDLKDYLVDNFNLIRDTIKIEWDDEGDCMITAREQGTIEYVSVSGTIR